jgi:phosphatidylserine decarboxylase
LHLRYRGPNHIPCAAKLKRGEEMGWFQHGSTIIAFVPPGVRLVDGLAPGKTVRMGQPLFKLEPVQ